MKPSEMTDEQLRIKVAELLNLCRPLICDQNYERGWRDLDGCVHYWCDERKNPPWPDYPNDLNACHEMEDCIPEEKRTAYYLILCGSGPLIGTHWRITHATARQRCIAFVEVMERA